MKRHGNFLLTKPLELSDLFHLKCTKTRLQPYEISQIFWGEHRTPTSKHGEGDRRGSKESGKGNGQRKRTQRAEQKGMEVDGAGSRPHRGRLWVYGVRGVNVPAQSKPGNIVSTVTCILLQLSEANLR
jgi:hypothetical protein